jgi:hypothetical protein
MSDLDDLGRSYPNGLRFNALTGAVMVSRYNPSTKQRSATEVPPGSRCAVDMLTRQRGLAKVTDKVFDFKLTPVGAPPPALEDETDYKPAVAMFVYSPDYGYCEIRTNSAITVRAISSLWDEYRAAGEAIAGQIPVMIIGEPCEVVIGRGTNNERRFWSPNFSITAWVDREIVPAFRSRKPTVPLPTAPAPLAIAKDLGARLGPVKPARRGSASAATVSAALDDEIPF